jgi:hypothetical protein
MNTLNYPYIPESIQELLNGGIERELFNLGLSLRQEKPFVSKRANRTDEK